MKSWPRDRFGDFGEEDENGESELENELYQTAMEGGREATEVDSKEEQRKRLSLFSGRARLVRRSVGFGSAGISGRSAIVQPGRGGQQIEQALMVETDLPAPDVPMGNLRKVVRSPRKNRSRIGAGRPSDTEVLPKFGPSPPSRIPDFTISQACIPRHPELRPAVKVCENKLMLENYNKSRQ